MRIGVVNNLSFGAKKKNIRMADDVQRAVRRTFYMFSPTYADTFYYTTNKDSKHHNEISKTTFSIQETIMENREQAQYPGSFPEAGFSEEDINTIYAPTLKKIQESHYGNCGENARAAVAALCANGFYNSRRAELYLQIVFENKKTGELSEPYFSSLDHSFAVTDMNEGGELNIIVDPWLGFADSKEGAIDKFKEIYTEKDFYEPVSFIKYNFLLSQESKGKDSSPNDYNTHTKLYIKIMQDGEFNEEDYKNLGDYTYTYFNDTVLYNNGKNS